MSVAATLAVSVNTDGRREVLGMSIGASGAEPFWTAFLRDPVRRCLDGVKLVISDAHERIKAARPVPSSRPGSVAVSISSAIPWPMPEKKQPTRRLGLHRHRLRPTRPHCRQGAMAPGL